MAIKFITTGTKPDHIYSDIYLDLTVAKTNAFKDATADIIDGNDIKVAYDSDAIRGSLTNLFTTRMGEIQLSPEYGLPLYKYIAEPISDNTANMIGQELNDAIIRWEKRVNIKKIYISPKPDLYMYHIVIELEIPKLKKTVSIGGSILTETMQFVLVDK